MDAVPQPILYTAIGGLCAVIAWFARLGVQHHESALKEKREEIQRLMEINAEKDAIIDRNSKTIAELVISFFFIPEEMKKPIATRLQEMEKAEQERRVRNG